jgi:hypothetical protein
MNAEDKKATRVSFGLEDWDFATTIFIGGVFFDNLRAVVSGYKEYETEKRELGDNITVRSTHGVDGKDNYLKEGENLDDLATEVENYSEIDAGYTYRKKILDLNRYEGEGTIETLLDKQNLGEIEEDEDPDRKDVLAYVLLDEYHRKTGLKSTVELDIHE